MVHECKRKFGLIQDCEFDGGDSVYCRSCGGRLKEDEIHPSIIKIMKNRRKK